jgi:RimJ/RimL family protein N-acetyltransferase
MLSDLDFVSRSRTTRQPAVHHAVGAHAARGRDPLPDFRHFIVEAGEAGRRRLRHPAGLPQPHGSVELKRIVLQPKGQGYGRACVRLLAQMAFRDLHAHRFWLDVKAGNPRAQALYRAEGFVEEGRLRDAVRTADGYDQLIVLSMLEDEHAALQARREEEGR